MQSATAKAVWNGTADISWHDASSKEFTVTTPEQLAGLAQLVNDGNRFVGKTIKLGADIMLNDTANWRAWAEDPPANVWTPIGKPIYLRDEDRYGNKPFCGAFDGNGFAVSGMYISGYGDYDGLFGIIDSGAAVEGLGVAASYIKGRSNVGGIAGEVRGGKIRGCHFAGAVLGRQSVGGIAGRSGGAAAVSGCHTAGTAVGLGAAGSWDYYGNNGDRYIGGLVGHNSGAVHNSYSTAEVTGAGVSGFVYGPAGFGQNKDGIVGGLVGYNRGGMINKCYFAGTVVGKENTGGLVGANVSGAVLNSYFIGTAKGFCPGGIVGSNSCLIRNSYSAGVVTGEKSWSVSDITGAGGIAGFNSGAISNSYSVSKVTGSGHIGGLAGDNAGAIMNAYYDKQTSGQSDTGKGVGKTTAEIMSKGFADSLNYMASLSSMNAWIYSKGKYPVLSDKKAAPINIGIFFERGGGTKASPYIIKTTKQLKNLSWLVNSGVDFSDKHLKLGADIVLNDTAMWRERESWQNDSALRVLTKNNSIDRWMAIGNDGSGFYGNFDGNGFVVSGIYIDNAKYNIGLFGVVGRSGTVKNLGVAFLYVKGNGSIGGLAGENSGAINNCYSYGIAMGEEVVGGLVGYNSGAINNSYSYAIAMGEEVVGGLVGKNSGTVDGSFFAGKATGMEKVGGLAGYNATNGVIKNSYSTGDVIGNGEFEIDIGGFVGRNEEGKIITSYSAGNVNVAGEESDGGIGGFVGNNKYCRPEEVRDYNNEPVPCYKSVIERSYHDQQTSGQIDGIGRWVTDRIIEDNSGSKSTAQMKQKTTFAGWDFDKVWGIDGRTNGGYPYLRENKAKP